MFESKQKVKAGLRVDMHARTGKVMSAQHASHHGERRWVESKRGCATIECAVRAGGGGGGGGIGYAEG
jgi:hypothetical protein